MHRAYFLYWQEIRKRRVSGQIAILFTLFIAVIFLFTIITVNIGILSGKKNAVDIAAETGALTLAAYMGSWAHLLSEKGIGPGKTWDCHFAGLTFLGKILFLAIAIATGGGWEAFFAGTGGAVSYVLFALGIISMAWQELILEPKLERALARALKKLSQKQQIHEKGIYPALTLTVSDQAKVQDTHDVDEDEDTQDYVNRFGDWYNQRLRDLYAQEQKEKEDDPIIKKIREFQTELRKFRDFAKGFSHFIDDPSWNPTPFPGVGGDWGFKPAGESLIGDSFTQGLFGKLEDAGFDLPFYVEGFNYDYDAQSRTYFHYCDSITVSGDACLACEKQECIESLLGFFTPADTTYTIDESNDSVDRMRYILGQYHYRQSVLLPTVKRAMINENGIIPVITAFINQSADVLRNSFNSWKGIFYYDGNPEDDNYSSGGIYELLGNGTEFPPGDPRYYPADTFYSLWYELGMWLEELRKIDPYSFDFTNPIRSWLPYAVDKIKDFRTEVGGSDGYGGLREEIFKKITEIEDLINTPPLPGTSPTAEKKQRAIYIWKDKDTNRGRGNWHFVYVKNSKFEMPWLRPYTETKYGVVKKSCVELRLSDNYNQKNPTEILVRRYDQQNIEPLPLVSGSPLWRMVTSRKPTDSSCNLTSQDLEALRAADTNENGVLTEEEIKAAGQSLETRVKNLFINCSIQSYVKAVYTYNGYAKLLKGNYSWEEGCPSPADCGLLDVEGY